MRSKVWQSRDCGSQPQALGRPGTPPARHYDLAARSSLHGLRRKCCRRKRGPRPKIATVERRKARVLRYWTQGASQAPGRAALRHAPPGAAAPGRLSALRPPLGGGNLFHHPGAIAPRERLGLFDIVSSPPATRNPPRMKPGSLYVAAPSTKAPALVDLFLVRSESKRDL